jgi:hypothetical protein
MLMIVSCVALFACTASSTSQDPEDPGPRSGLSEDASIGDLSSTEREALCMWWGETLAGVGRQQQCSECEGDACVDWTISVSTLADCIEWLETVSCHATIRQAEDCAFSQIPDLCASPAACDPLDAC